MAKIEIKSAQDLEKHLGDIGEKLNVVEVKSSEAIEAAEKKSEELAQKNTDLGQKIEELTEKIKTVTLAFKTNWRKEGDDQDAKDYRFGKLVKALMEKDGKTLSELGAAPNRAKGDEDGWRGPEGWNFRKSDVGTPLRGDEATGSYLVGVEYSSEVLRVAADASAMMGLVRTIPMSARSIKYPASLTELGFTWVTNEETAKTEKKPTFAQKTLECETAAGWVTITEELNEDSLVPLGGYFKELFGEAWGTEFDKQCLEASTPFSGILQAAGVNEVIMGTGKVGFDDVECDDLLDLVASLDTKTKRAGARFFLHATVFDHVRKFKDANGDYIYQKPAEGQPGTIWGYPYVLSDGMPDKNDSAVSTPFIGFGNPRHILHGDRIGMEFRVFDQTEAAMQYDRIYFRCRLRQGFLVGVPAAFGKLTTASE